MEKKIKCPICDLEATLLPTRDTHRISCPICGEFNIGSPFKIPSFNIDEKIKLMYYYYTTPKDNAELRLQNYITELNKNEFLNKITAPKTILEKLDNILKYIKDNTHEYGEYVQIERNNGYRQFFCKDDNEFDRMLNDLEEKKLINIKKVSSLEVLDTPKTTYRGISITTKGFQYVEKLEENKSDLTQCFIAMWFNKCTNNFYKASKQTVENNTGFKVLKIDDYEHINYIPIEIINQIKNSRFMIADLTGHRGGVYYEAGYAEALNIPVIYTCRKDWFEEKKDIKGKIIRNGVHFDIKQKNILMWQNNKLDDFQEKLLKMIKQVIV